MREAKASVSQRRNRKGKKLRGGRRSLYDPKLGASNYRKAQEGRFADHAAFRACKKLFGAFVAIQRMVTNGKSIKLRAAAVARQMDKALCDLHDAAAKLKTPSDKLRFAEAIAWFFDPTKSPDVTVWCTCWRAIEMRGPDQKPSQAELRHALEREDGIRFSDEQWKRVMRRTGLNKELLTHRQKRQGGVLPKV